MDRHDFPRNVEHIIEYGEQSGEALNVTKNNCATLDPMQTTFTLQDLKS
jgi:hypothetical protein